VNYIDSRLRRGRNVADSDDPASPANPAIPQEMV
jgi:polar amino acid transport system substrate-binding protein